MSVIRNETVSCPSCKAVLDIDVLESINADRRPDLRQAIVEGRLQVENCSACNAQFLVEPSFNYIDAGRKQWISAQPLAQLGAWAEVEQTALRSFNRAYGAEAPAVARAIGAELVARVSFGWAGLREKIIAAEAGLDDRVLEYLKLAIIQSGSSLGAGRELRLEAVEGDSLVMIWTDSRTEKQLETLAVPRRLYEDIHADAAAWAGVDALLGEGPFVDLQKIYIGGAGAAVQAAA
jgi:hypothetical protein